MDKTDTPLDTIFLLMEGSTNTVELVVECFKDHQFKVVAICDPHTGKQLRRRDVPHIRLHHIANAIRRHIWCQKHLEEQA